ncbi:hypothetical protein CHARACLAT_033637 [Characodon lateralis]|uniref:Ig-like domain-containing protein n=1 Tax=Characodon lateralis TaxID=208331 RepID=A0ABU7EFB5_9TELE|nr:hypothetical protein [Characodon lateralis]
MTTVAGPSGEVFNITEEGIYSCRGFKMEENFMTSTSDDIIIYKIVSNKVSVTLQPSWSQIFRGERITLRCEIQRGGGAQWTYEWKTTNRNSPTSNEYWIISATESYSGEYSCMGRRGHEITGWSDAFRLTVLCESECPL